MHHTQTTEGLASLGLPSTDAGGTAASPYTFKGGGAFGIELSSANTPEILQTLLSLVAKNGLEVARFIECRGIVRLTDAEIAAMVELAASHRKGLYLSVGPRAVYGRGGFVRSKNGARQGYRVQGMEGVARALDDLFRAYELGARGFVVYDEGLLDVLGQLRANQKLPADVLLKFSVHGGCSNAASASLLERLGADCINPVPDLELAMIASIRAAVRCPLDLFTDTAGDAGGMVLTHDVPWFVRLAAPVYLKCGPVSQAHQNHLPSDLELKERVKQAVCVVETLRRALPDATGVTATEPTLAIPVSKRSVPIRKTVGATR